MPQPKLFNSTLTGKVAIVTGAGTEGDGIGIGRAIATILAAEGARVCVVDMKRESAEGTLKFLESLGGQGFVSTGDVSNRDDCARFVNETVDRYGRLDILVNNVGIAPSVPLEAENEDLWLKVLNVNLTSAMLMSRYSVPQMIKSGGGSIINISSIAGMLAQGGGVAYGPSKAAMEALARELTIIYGRQGIRANTVAPGHLMTPLAASLLPASMRAMRKNVGPLGQEGDAWDVAHAVRYLASDESRFIANVHLAVDGGVTQIGPVPAHGLIVAGEAK